MARLIDPFEQFFDGSGNPLVSGLLYFFESGSSSLVKPTYADSGMTILNSNPVVLNGDGRCPNVFGVGSYRVILATADDVQLISRDPVGGDSDLGFGADWNEEIIYSQNEVVFDAGSYWVSLTNNNQNNRPSTDGMVNWAVANFGAGAPANAPVFNHAGGPDSDVLLTNNDTIHPLVYRLDTTGASFGFDGLSVLYSGDAIAEIKSQVTYPFTDNRVLVASETDARVITNLSAGWASRVEYVFSTSGSATFGGILVVRQGDNVTLGASSTAKDFNLANRKVGWAPAALTFDSGTLTAAHGNNIVFSGGAGTWTVPSTVGTAGTVIQLINASVVTKQIVQDSGVIVTWLQGGSSVTGTRNLAQKSVATLVQDVIAGRWFIYGNGLS